MPDTTTIAPPCQPNTESPTPGSAAPQCGTSTESLGGLDSAERRDLWLHLEEEDSWGALRNIGTGFTSLFIVPALTRICYCDPDVVEDVDPTEIDGTDNEATAWRVCARFDLCRPPLVDNAVDLDDPDHIVLADCPERADAVAIALALSVVLCLPFPECQRHSRDSVHFLRNTPLCAAPPI